MRLMSVALAAALVGGAPLSQAAEPEAFVVDTAADLARLCAINPVHPNYMAAIHLCHGYLIGVHHFQAALAAEMEQPLYCAESASPPPTRNTAAADFSAWIEANPEMGETEALDALLTWATATYPCS